MQLRPPNPREEPVAPPADLPAPDYEQPGISGEGPAEFALIDELTEPASAHAVETPPEPDVDLMSALQLDMPHVEASPIEARCQRPCPNRSSW